MKYIKNIFMEFIYVFYNNFVCYIPSWSIRKVLYRLGGMKIGKHSRICMKTVVIKPWRISIGERTIINEHCHLDGRGGITIGNDSSISIYSILLTGTHDSNTFGYVEKPITIGDKVWVCAGSIVCPGCELKDKVLIGAGSTLKAGVYSEDYFYSGVPAVFVRKRNAENYKQSIWKPWFR